MDAFVALLGIPIILMTCRAAVFRRCAFVDDGPERGISPEGSLFVDHMRVSFMFTEFRMSRMLPCINRLSS